MEAPNLAARGCQEYGENITFLHKRLQPGRPQPVFHSVTFQRDAETMVEHIG
jgi:hypothetical protein